MTGEKKTECIKCGKSCLIREDKLCSGCRKNKKRCQRYIEDPEYHKEMNAKRLSRYHARKAEIFRSQAVQ